MDLFANDKWLLFMVDQYAEIEALVADYEYAQSRAAGVVKKAITDATLDHDLFRSGSPFSVRRNTNGTLYWYHQDIYDPVNESGFFFWLDPAITWEHLVRYGPHLSINVRLEYEKATASLQKQVLSALSAKAAHWAKLQMAFAKAASEGEPVLKLLLFDTFGLADFRSAERVRTSVQESISRFTLNVAEALSLMTGSHGV